MNRIPSTAAGLRAATGAFVACLIFCGAAASAPLRFAATEMPRPDPCMPFITETSAWLQKYWPDGVTFRYYTVSDMEKAVQNREDLKTWQDLQHKKLAATSIHDFTGFQAAMGELLHRGYDPVSFFADVDMFGNTSKTAQASVVDKVIGGQADAGIVRTCFLEDLAGLRKTELPVRVIEPYDDPNFACRRSTALYPNWTISSVPTLTAEELRRVMELLFAMPPTSNGMFWSVAPSDNLMKELKIGPYDFLRHWTIERLWTEYRTLAGSNHPSNADNDGEAQKPQPSDASAGHRNIENNVAVPNEVCLC